jgi:hypothetical protein
MLSSGFRFALFQVAALCLQGLAVAAFMSHGWLRQGMAGWEIGNTLNVAAPSPAPLPALPAADQAGQGPATHLQQHWVHKLVVQ